MESMPQKHASRDTGARSAMPFECELELPVGRPDDAANDLRMSKLARTIEEEIIPRLMLAHRSQPDLVARPDVADGVHGEIASADVEAFAKLVLSHDEDVAFSMIHALRGREVPVEKIYLDLLAPTARYLGSLWDDDLCNFTDVTVGLGRLQRVLRELSPHLGQGVEHANDGRRILLLPSPGEQHTFGLVMVAEFFRTAGWDVVGGAWAAGADAAQMVSTEWFDVVGFSLGAESRMSGLATVVSAVRHATCNRELAVLVGGPIFESHPEFAAQVGADGMTIDGREAPVLAESLITRKLIQQSSRG